MSPPRGQVKVFSARSVQYSCGVGHGVGAQRTSRRSVGRHASASRPGWTTIAEVAFFNGMVDSLIAQVEALTTIHAALLDAAERVELNPQPLPP